MIPCQKYPSQTWSLEEPGLWAVVMLQGPDQVLAGVAHVLLHQGHPRVVEGRPAVDDAVMTAAEPLIDHREVELVDPGRIDLQ